WTPNGSTLGNSQVQDNGVTLGIGAAPGAQVGKVDVVGTGAISPYGDVRIGNSVAGSLGGTLGISNPNATTNTAAAIGFDVDGTNLWGAGGVNGTNAEIRAINMLGSGGGGDNRTDLAFSNWNGGAEAENMRIASSGTTSLRQVNPYLDNTYSLGTPALRWQELYVGPSSLHLKEIAADYAGAGVAEDWALGVANNAGPGA